MSLISNTTNNLWKPRGSVSQPAPFTMPRLIWEVLASRGFEGGDEIQKWLSPSLKDLREPFSLKDMDKAVARLVQAYEANERICIYADFDLDGTSGLALLKSGFELLGFRNFTWYQPRRLSEGYGLHGEAVRKLAADGVQLLITVDLGITAVEEVRLANELGLEVIVTDHHLPKEVLPPAYAVINPNQEACNAGLGHLCGTGVAFYLVLALRRAFLERGFLNPEDNPDFDPKQLLDCFVIGTLTDMVPLVDENRVLVKHGLHALERTKRPGLRVLLQALNLWGIPLTSQDVAIRFAPKLNALSRMEMGILPIDLYLVEDETEAQSLVEQVLVNNQQRVSMQRDAELEAIGQLSERRPQGCVWVWSRSFHRGVVGLVATKLCQKFGLPAFVGSCNEEGQVIGSARIPEGHAGSLLDALESAQQALVKFGGHSVAAGFELQVDQADVFHAALEAHYAALDQAPAERAWVYDAEATLEELDSQFMRWYEHLSPFGAHFAAPIFLLRDVSVTGIRPLKGGHYRLTFGGRFTGTGTGIWFSAPPEHPLLQEGVARGQKVSVLVEPQWNHFAGRKSLQLLVQDLRLS